MSRSRFLSPRSDVVHVTAAVVLALSVACSDGRHPGPLGPSDAVPSPRFNTGPSSAKLFISEQNGRVLRYDVTQGGGATFETAITVGSNPHGIAIDAAGEMFVVNASDNSVSRILDPEDPAPTAYATITSSDFNVPVFTAFGNGELFVSQIGGANVLRFIFDADGNAVPNGQIGPLTGGDGTRGVQVNPVTGELFVGLCCDTNRIDRYLFDASGNAVPNVTNGNIPGEGLAHDMVFSSWGELFVANFNGGVSRYTFDGAGNATHNGDISDLGGGNPIGLDFSPWGELFVSIHQGTVYQFTFDAGTPTGPATPSGSFQVNPGLSPAAGWTPDLQFGLDGGGNSAPAVTTDSDPVAVDEGQTATNTGSVSDADGDVVTLSASLGTITNNNGTWSWSFDTSGLPPGSQTVTITADDANGGITQTSFQLIVNGASATLFISDQNGGRVLRYNVTEGGGVAFETAFDVGVGPHGIALDAGGEMFVANSFSPSISRVLDPEGPAPTEYATITDARLVDHGPVFMTFRNDELFVAQIKGNNVLRYTFDAGGNAIPNGEIASLTGGDGTRGIRVNPATGELFVGLCCGDHRILRFLINATGASPNGAISDPGLAKVHDMAFSPSGELFATNYPAGTVSRFIFDASGNAIANSQIVGFSNPIGLAFSPWGELFVSNHLNNRVDRFTFDASGNAIDNGSFMVNPGLVPPAEWIPDLHFAPGDAGLISVEIDIKPGSYPNCFNNNGHGVIPVAILSSPTFDATQVDAATVELEGLAVSVRGKSNKLMAHQEDVNGDGLVDLVVQIEDVDDWFNSGEDSSATLTGTTFDGTEIEGTDSICIVPGN